MGLKNVEDRSQRLQETLLTLRGMSAEGLLEKQKNLRRGVKLYGDHEYSLPSKLRDELRLIEEEIQRRHGKETH